MTKQRLSGQLVLYKYYIYMNINIFILNVDNRINIHHIINYFIN
jgi:hypothetical protein